MGNQGAAKILIVDDDPRVRSICARFLFSMGHQTTQAAGGEEALGLLGTEFDIVLTDLGMPGTINGNELTRRARALSSSDVIIMTGNPELKTALQALKDGAYDYLIKPFGDEILRHAVRRCLDKRGLSNELAKEKALRSELDRAYTELSTLENLRDTFGQFVTPAVARFVLDNPHSVSDQGEQLSLTVLFADVRGFTPFAARVTPREAVLALNQIFACFIGPIDCEGGILNKFIGDGMMAVFGTPSPLKNNAAAAAHAAMSALRSIESLAVAREKQGLIGLRVGVGINTGEMIAGCLGTAQRTEYSVIGAAVNVASRLVEMAKPGQILIGPETTALLAPDFELIDHGAMEFKGLSGRTRVAEIAGLSRIPACAPKRQEDKAADAS